MINIQVVSSLFLNHLQCFTCLRDFGTPDNFPLSAVLGAGAIEVTFSSDNKTLNDDMAFEEVYRVFDFNSYIYTSLDTDPFHPNKTVNTSTHSYHVNSYCTRFGFEGSDPSKSGPASQRLFFVFYENLIILTFLVTRKSSQNLHILLLANTNGYNIYFKNHFFFQHFFLLIIRTDAVIHDIFLLCKKAPIYTIWSADGVYTSTSPLNIHPVLV